MLGSLMICWLAWGSSSVAANQDEAREAFAAQLLGRMCSFLGSAPEFTFVSTNEHVEKEGSARTGC